MHAPSLHRLARRAASLKTMMLVFTTVALLIYVASYSTHRSVCARCTAATVHTLTHA
jgi:hypothetical protein